MSPAAAQLLVVAGHDPTGGAGVDADCSACERFDVRVTTVTSAETDQDGARVHAVRARDPADWLAEAREALGRERFGALKSGLLPGAGAVRAFALLCAEARAQGVAHLVVDPVLAASAGEPFLDAAGRRALLEELLPQGPILTPNLPEAALLSGREPGELADPRARIEPARELLARGARAVVLKGGHGAENPVRELVLERGAEPVWIEHPRVPGAGLHGSGCRFASALACGLLHERSLPAAARDAGAWLVELLRAPGG